MLDFARSIVECIEDIHFLTHIFTVSLSNCMYHSIPLLLFNIFDRNLSASPIILPLVVFLSCRSKNPATGVRRRVDLVGLTVDFNDIPRNKLVSSIIACPPCVCCVE